MSIYKDLAAKILNGIEDSIEEYVVPMLSQPAAVVPANVQSDKNSSQLHTSADLQSSNVVNQIALTKEELLVFGEYFTKIKLTKESMGDLYSILSNLENQINTIKGRLSEHMTELSKLNNKALEHNKVILEKHKQNVDSDAKWKVDLDTGTLIKVS